MRAQLQLVAMSAALAGCASMRSHPAPAPALVASPADDERVAAPSARSTRGALRHLACIQHPRVDAWERRLRTDRGLWAASVHGPHRGARYLPGLRRALAEAGLPESLALLPVVESGFRADARSRDGGGGLWQLQRRTAQRFGLEVSARRDERFDPQRSTQAAVRYLRFLHARYRDWPLALAAYNAGEGRVDRALGRHAGATVWELAQRRHIPPRTGDYVGRFLAVVRLVDAPRTDC